METPIAAPIPAPPIYAKMAIEDKANTFLICILTIFTFPIPAINKQINIPILIISSVEKK